MRKSPQKHSRALLLLLLCSITGGVTAAVLSTRDAALARLFPGAELVRDTVYLDEAQREQAAKLAGREIRQGIVYRYAVRHDGQLLATAYLDSHRVRTLREVLMTVVSPSNTVRHVEVLAFDEPQEYMPRRAWYEQFTGRALGPELQLGRGIDGVTGATLSGRATTDAVRRALALQATVPPNAP